MSSQTPNAAPGPGSRSAAAWHEPTEGIGGADLERSLRLLIHDGVLSQVMGALTGGAILVAFALHLGATNTAIGMIAAIAPLSQLLQVPAILLVERTRRRKLLTVLGSGVGRLAWFLIAALPLVQAELRIPLLLVGLFVFYGTGTVSSCAFNSWKRDLVPEEILGRYLAKRLAVATAVGAAVTLGAGLVIDQSTRWLGDPLFVYAALFVGGGCVGLAGVALLGRIDEPRMAPPPEQGLVQVLTEPLRDGNFRALLFFLGSWNFAVNLAAPFFAVYMLVRLELGLALVLGLSVLSQIANVLFYRIWGRLADRLGSKAVLGLSGWLFIISIGAWPFTTMPEKYVLTLPLLVAIHMLAGISTAGVNLGAATIALKLAPKGKATSFLATNALTSGMAATGAPIVAGLLADRLASERLALELRWISGEAARVNLPAVDLEGLDFLFAIAFLFGLYALHRLLAVRELGEVEGRFAFHEFQDEVRKAVRHVSNVAGLRQLSAFPFMLLRRRAPRPAEPASGAPGAPPDEAGRFPPS